MLNKMGAMDRRNDYTSNAAIFLMGWESPKTRNQLIQEKWLVWMMI
jgi:hypothetical protein